MCELLQTALMSKLASELETRQTGSWKIICTTPIQTPQAGIIRVSEESKLDVSAVGQ